MATIEDKVFDRLFKEAEIATFLPFRAYNTDNQLIIDTVNVQI